jgi:chemotaxis protein MotC
LAAPVAQSSTAASAAAPAQADATIPLPASASAAGSDLDPHDPTDAAMIGARRQLDQIDQLLGAAPK